MEQSTQLQTHLPKPTRRHVILCTTTLDIIADTVAREGLGSRGTSAAVRMIILQWERDRLETLAQIRHDTRLEAKSNE